MRSGCCSELQGGTAVLKETSSGLCSSTAGNISRAKCHLYLGNIISMVFERQFAMTRACIFCGVKFAIKF